MDARRALALGEVEAGIEGLARSMRGIRPRPPDKIHPQALAMLRPQPPGRLLAAKIARRQARDRWRRMFRALIRVRMRANQPHAVRKTCVQPRTRQASPRRVARASSRSSDDPGGDPDGDGPGTSSGGSGHPLAKLTRRVVGP
jgi:hypothetical protein